MTSAISVRDLTVTYTQRPVLWDIDLDVPTGQLAALIGPNGAGKSTLFKAILNLIKPVSGTISILGTPLPDGIRQISYVPQRSAVDWDFPIDVFETVLMGTYGKLGWFKRPGKAEKLLAEQALEQVGLSNYAGTQISELSGGQQQRVFMARALAQQAPVTLLDEPLAGVDEATETKILEILQSLRAQQKSVIVVHHDLQTVRDYFDHITLLNTKVIASGPVQQVMTTENLQATYGGRLLTSIKEPKA